MTSHSITKPTRPRLVICCGMPHAGPEEQYRLACALLEQQGPIHPVGFIAPGKAPPQEAPDPSMAVVCQLQHWDEQLAELLRRGEAKALYCFRDLMDVALCQMRGGEVSFQTLWDQRWLQSAAKAGDQWLAEPGIYSSKYEMAVTAPVEEALRIAAHLGVSADSNVIGRLTGDAVTIAGPANRRTSSTTSRRSGTLQLSAAQSELIATEFHEWRKVRGYAPPAANEGAQAPVYDASEVYVPHIGWLKHARQDEVAHLLRQGHYEADLQAFSWLYLRKGHRVLDVGAHFGLYSELASLQVGSTGSVVAIEPNPQSLDLLRANFNTAKNVRILPVAISDSAGSIPFTVEPEGKSAHSFIGTGGDSIHVSATTLDELVRSLGWTSVDFLKIDTEGHEFSVLTGATGSIEAGLLPVLAIEFAEDNLLRIGRSTRQLADALAARGYVLAQFDISKLQLKRYEGPWPIWYQNLFAVHDLEFINCQLEASPPESQQIAREVAHRYEATRHWQEELNELINFKQRAKLADERERWARDAEARFQREQLRADRATTWAHAAEQRAAVATTLATANEKWARQAEERARQAAEIAAANEKWARESDERHSHAEKMLSQLKATLCTGSPPVDPTKSQTSRLAPP